MARPKLSVTPPPEDSATKRPWRVASQIQAADLSWMLPDRIVQNGLCIVEGDTRAGKSTFLAHLVASITTGKPWAGRPRSTPARVMWLTGEEDFGSQVLPRLLAAGANTDMVHDPGVDESGMVRQLYLPGCVRELQDMILDLGLALIIMEPLVSFVGADLALTQEGPARSVADPLNRLSLNTGCCIIVTRGLRKDRSGPRLVHGSGHPSLAGASRSILLVECPDPERERRTIRTLKNYGSPPPVLQYEHQRTGRNPAKIVGLVELSPQADDPQAQTRRPGEHHERIDAKALLQILCATEYIAVNTLKAAAEDSGICWRIMQDVKAELQVHSRPTRDGGKFHHEWGPPLDGWPPPPPPVRSTPCAVPTTRKTRKKPGKTV